MAKAIGMKSLLELPDKGLSLAENPPAQLFRLMLLDRNVTWANWVKYIEAFIASDRSGLPDDSVRRHSEKTNLNRSLSYDEIQWHRLRRGLLILNPKHVRYIIDLQWSEDLIHPVEPPSQVVYDGIGGGEELTNIYRNIGLMIELTHQSWNALVTRWITDPKNGIPNNPHDHSTERGNLRQRVLDNDRFSWDMFTKAMRIIGVDKFKLTAELQWKNNSKASSLHTVLVELNK